MLDVLEDAMRLWGYPCERLDGSVASRDRAAAIDRFNDPAGGAFVFLLSTRAGGQGITLTAANTVVIYDSDFNPQNDLQAMARAHRIGQTREVKIYRLLADRTYEQAIYDAASKKYGLDEAILGGLGGGPADAKRIASLLRDGAMALGDAAAADEAAAAFAAEDIDSILANRTSRHTLAGRAGNTFSVATFGHATSDAGDRDFWATVLPDAVAAHDAAQAFFQAGQELRERRSSGAQGHEDEAVEHLHARLFERVLLLAETG